MRVRSTPAAGKAAPTGHVSIDLVIITLRGSQLCVLTASAGASARGDLVLPWGQPGRGESLEDAAKRIARQAAGSLPGWIEQGGALAEGTHPGGADLSVCYIAVLPWGEPAGAWGWTAARSVVGLGERQRRMVTSALSSVRVRSEQAPVAFRLLPREFTLAELQRAYEGLLGHRLHKAAFRRSLQASWLVEPMDTWRTEGRGRPAQLFRYSPRRRKGRRRGVRFDIL